MKYEKISGTSGNLHGALASAKPGEHISVFVRYKDGKIKTALLSVSEIDALTESDEVSYVAYGGSNRHPT